MLTEFNSQSATRVKNATVFYYIHAILHTIALSACSIVLSVFIMKCMLKLPYLNYVLEEPHQPVLHFPKGSFGRKKPVHCSFQGKWFIS